MRRILPLIVVLASLVGCTRQPQMPDIFLGTWAHEEERFHLTVNPDGTMTDIYAKDKTMISEYQYKVLHVYNPERVAILYKEKPYFGDYNGQWMKPEVALIWIHHPEYHKNIISPTFHFGVGCPIENEEEWNDVQKYHDALMKKIDSLYPDSSCIDGSIQHKLWSLDDTKFH